MINEINRKAITYDTVNRAFQIFRFEKPPFETED